MATGIGAPIVLLVEPSGPNHHHAEMLRGAGFEVVTLPMVEITEDLLRDVSPAIVAVELDSAHASDALGLNLRLLSELRQAVPVPIIVYGHGLSACDIERVARGGAMWLQLEPSDGAKLVGAIRGVLAAAESQSRTGD
jgi:hypothetical protein